jgi:hypothetical protein
MNMTGISPPLHLLSFRRLAVLVYSSLLYDYEWGFLPVFFAMPRVSALFFFISFFSFMFLLIMIGACAPFAFLVWFMRFFSFVFCT